jgi:hypothetical protein
MGRKSNLGGLAALAGLAYMMTRDKAKKGESPAASTASTPAPEVKVAEPITAPKYKDAMQEKEPGWDTKEAPVKSAPVGSSRPAADSRFVTPEVGAKAYRSRARSDSSLSAPDPREALMRNYVPRRDPKATGAMSGDFMANSAKSRGVRNMYERGAEETGMKKGGSVKGWGMARGARKAKTY